MVMVTVRMSEQKRRSLQQVVDEWNAVRPTGAAKLSQNSLCLNAIRAEIVRLREWMLIKDEK